jgi:hypothetical protein
MQMRRDVGKVRAQMGHVGHSPTSKA